MVYVLDVSGKPLTPTKRHGKVRHLLETGKAVCVKRCPFTIRLTYQNAGPEPEGLSLGVDCGSKHIGLSISSEEQEYYSSEVELRQDMTANQLPAVVKGFRLYDKVLFQNRECFIWGRRKTGYFTLKTLNGIMICDGVRSKKLTLLEKRKSYLTERRKQELCNSFSCIAFTHA